jgi:peptidoglycan/LPS O-acetylase OafA/YrhL
MALYALSVLACDVGGFTLGFLRTFGRNALAGYLIHGVVDEFVRPFVPRDAPLWYLMAGFALYFGITYVFLRSLEKRGLFLRL